MRTTNTIRRLQIAAFLTTMVLMINCSSEDSSPSASQIEVVGNVTSFGAVDVLSNSVSQSIQVKGINLSEAMSLTASINFEVSLDDTNFESQVSIDKVTANSEHTSIYIRFSPTQNAVGSISGNLSIQSAQASAVSIALIGSGVSITPVVTIAGTIANFSDVMIGENSDAQTLVLNGDNLTSDLTITTTANFELSLDNNSFLSTVQIPVADVNEDVTLYVRFVPSELGAASGTLTLTSAGMDDFTIDLNGNGTPLVYSYVAFNQQPLGFGGGFNQSASQIFNLHTDLFNISQIKMYVQIDCPSTGCDDWDRFANIKVKDPNTGNWFEIGRYITPYWVGTGLLERGLEFDVTDFKSLLTGATELRIYIENWTQKADLITIEFDYIEGTPDYPYYAVSEVLGYHLNSIDGVPYGVAHNFDLTKQVSIASNAEDAHLRTLISGWGHAGPTDSDGRPCAEWCFRSHDIKINNVATFNHNLAPIGCAANPISNQNPGNWTPDRAGWCPGMAVPTRVDNLNTTAGSTFSFEYDFEDWTNDNSNGSAYYATSTYVVVKSNSVIAAPTVTD